MTTTWLPSEAHRRWAEMQNYIRSRDHAQPWPADRVNELVSIATQLARQQHELVLLASQMLLPWKLVRRDMNHLTAILGRGWSTYTPDNIAVLEAAMRERHADDPDSSPDDLGE